MTMLQIILIVAITTVIIVSGLAFFLGQERARQRRDIRRERSGVPLRERELPAAGDVSG